MMQSRGPRSGRLARARRGKFLLEMLVAVSMMSVVLGATSLTLWSLFRIERQLSGDADQLTGYARLGKLWRADAHAALSADAADGCTFTFLDGRRARYWIDGQQLRRELRQGDTTLHRESFGLPPGASPLLAVSASGERAVAELTLSASGQPPRLLPKVRPLRVSAVVNLHQARPPAEESIQADSRGPGAAEGHP